jgi:hypothetical protein
MSSGREGFLHDHGDVKFLSESWSYWLLGWSEDGFKDMIQLEFRLHMISIHNVLCYSSVYVNDIAHLQFSKISSNLLRFSSNKSQNGA